MNNNDQVNIGQYQIQCQLPSQLLVSWLAHVCYFNAKYSIYKIDMSTRDLILSEQKQVTTM